MNKSDLLSFIKESNMIERIYIDAKGQQGVYEQFLALPELEIDDLREFVGHIQPGNVLRSEEGLNVRVGDYIAPRGGPEIVAKLEYILSMANSNIMTPYEIHQRYETLHPFTDGNGRSGRALWLWQTEKFQLFPPIDGSFLHTYYYQSLSHERR